MLPSRSFRLLGPAPGSVARLVKSRHPAIIDGLPKGVYALDFSPDGRLLAQGGADGRVRVWRVRRGSTRTDAAQD